MKITQHFPVGSIFVWQKHALIADDYQGVVGEVVEKGRLPDTYIVRALNHPAGKENMFQTPLDHADPWLSPVTCPNCNLFKIAYNDYLCKDCRGDD